MHGAEFYLPYNIGPDHFYVIDHLSSDQVGQMVSSQQFLLLL
jgi:hypothetical protein